MRSLFFRQGSIGRNGIPLKPNPNKTTVHEELEYWNALHVYRRINDYYRTKLRFKTKSLQGLESSDFAMMVMEKIISEDVSWQRSGKACFIDFVYDVARGQLSHFIRDNKERRFMSYDFTQDRIGTNRIKDNYNGF